MILDQFEDQMLRILLLAAIVNLIIGISKDGYLFICKHHNLLIFQLGTWMVRGSVYFCCYSYYSIHRIWKQLYQGEIVLKFNGQILERV